MKTFLFLGFLGATGLLFWSARKKFQVDGELTWKNFFVGVANRGTDLVFLGSAFTVAVYLFTFFSPMIEGLDSDSIIKSLLVLCFSGAIVVPVVLILKKTIGKKEMIFVYGLSFLAFALIIRAKVPGIFDIPECQFDLAIWVYLGALLVIWICSYWESDLQEKFALPVGFFLLAAQFLWSGYLKTGSPWQEYMREPAIITFFVALFVLQFVFYRQIAWRWRIGYWGFMFPIFVFTLLQGLAVVALLWHGSLSLGELAYRREAPRLIETSIKGEDLELCNLKGKVADLQKKRELLPSERIELPFLSKDLLRLESEKLKFAKKHRGELRGEFYLEDDLLWAFKKIWQDIILPNYNSFKKGGDV